MTFKFSKLSSSIFFIILIASGILSQASSTVLNCQTDNSKSDVFDIEVDAIVKDYMADTVNCGLSIAIYNNSQIAYYNYGEVERGSQKLPSNTTIYEIASVTKTFTGILLAQAVLDHKVNLNDDIRLYLPDEYPNLAYDEEPIQLVHLADHTSRIPRLPADLDKQPDFDPLDPYKHYSKALVFNCLKTIQLDTYPGTQYEYSNLGMALLGIILEGIYNQTFEDLVINYISAPQGLVDTKITLNEDEEKRFAKGYNIQGAETPHWNFGDMAGAGGLRSTTADMIDFVEANLKEENEAMKLSHVQTFDDGTIRIALSWHFLTTEKGNEMIWHNGNSYGFASFAGFIKSKGLGIVVLSNSANLVDLIAVQIMGLME